LNQPVAHEGQTMGPKNASTRVNALRVLVVEDDAMLGMLLGEMLEDMGHDIDPLETTQAGAVAAAARRRPDLMIVDVGLGEGSGLVAMDDILANGFVPHIFMSGNVRRVEAQRPGTPVLQKPFDQDQLERAIRGVLTAAPLRSRGLDCP